jgi:vitamin B12 transporter
MRRIIPLLVLLLKAQTALAQQADLALPETLVTTTRPPLAITDIAAGVSVIDRQQIESSGAVTLADVLQTVPGLHVSPSGGAGGQASLFMRGTNAGHVLVLRDGMPINDPSDPNGAFNFGTETLSDIERIEVVRGPMAALYGSGAIGGVINLISRRGVPGPARLEIDLSGGYPATIAGAASVSGGTGPFDYALTVESQSRRGFDATPQREASYTNTPQGFRDRIATANLGYTPIDGTRISLFLRGSETFFGLSDFGLNPTAGTPDAANANGATDSLLGRIGVTSRLFGGTWETGAFAGHDHDDRHYTEALNPADPAMATVDERYHTDRTDLQWNNTVHLNDLIPALIVRSTDLTFGAEETIDQITGRANDSYYGSADPEDVRATSHATGLYGGLTSTLLNRLILSGQVRRDWIDDNARATWRLGAVVKVPEIDTVFRTAYGTAFRAPSLYERFGADAQGYTVGNPLLRPEWSEGWEIGFTSTFPILARQDALSFGATFFDQRITDLIDNVVLPSGAYGWANVDAARIDGVEAEVTIRPGSFLSVHASYTFTDTTTNSAFLPPGAALVRRPKNSAEIDAAITPLPGFRIVPALIYTGPAFDYLYDNQGNSTGYGVGQHGLVANLSASYDLKPNARLYLNATNLFGSRYEPVNGFQMPGTAVIAGVRMHW